MSEWGWRWVGLGVGVGVVGREGNVSCLYKQAFKKILAFLVKWFLLTRSFRKSSLYFQKVSCIWHISETIVLGQCFPVEFCCGNKHSNELDFLNIAWSMPQVSVSNYPTCDPTTCDFCWNIDPEMIKDKWYFFPSKIVTLNTTSLSNFLINCISLWKKTPAL